MHDIVDGHCDVLHQRAVSLIHGLVYGDDVLLGRLNAVLKLFVELVEFLPRQLLLNEGVEVLFSLVFLLLLRIGFLVALVRPLVAHGASFVLVVTLGLLRGL